MREREEKLSRYSEASEHTLPDVETVRRAMGGDKEAFGQLFQSTYRRMFFVARRILSQDEDIYDALQIAYSKAYKYIGRVSPPENFYSWLSKIVENSAKDVWRNLHPDEELSSDMEELPSPDIVEDADRRVLIARVLKDMDPHRAEVLVLYYYDGLKLNEIAKLLGEPISTVHSRLKAAKREITELLEQSGIDRSFYSGGFFSAIAVSLRSLLGTDILSAAVAQKMMDEVLTGKPGRLDVAAAKLAERQRNKAILRVAALLMILVVIVTLLTSAIANGWFFRNEASSTGDGLATTTVHGAVVVATQTTTTSHVVSATTSQVNVLPVLTTTVGDAVTSKTTDTRNPNTTTVTTGSEMVIVPVVTTGTTPVTATKSTTTMGKETNTTGEDTVTTKAPIVITTTVEKVTTTTTTSSSPITPAEENLFNYTVSNDKATITGLKSAFKGDLIIPPTLAGYSVTSIGAYAFGNTGIFSVTIPDSVTMIGDWAFSGCSSLTSVMIGDSVETIGEFAFNDCYRLTSLILGNRVKTIGRQAFYNCGLKTLKVQGAVETIGGGAFNGCSGLTSLTIGDSVKLIADSAFGRCEKLTEVWIGKGVQEIGMYIFADCTELKTVYYAGSKEEREAITIGRLNEILLSANWVYNAQQ